MKSFEVATLLSPFKNVKDISSTLTRHKTKKYDKRLMSKVQKIIVHCTDRDWTIEQLNTFDVQGFLKLDDGTIEKNHISATGLPAISYHDVIMPTGEIFHVLPYNEISWHAAGYNTESMAVALMFRATDPKTNRDIYSPTDAARKALESHLIDLCMYYKVYPTNVLGHRELHQTGWIMKDGIKRLVKTCPGLSVDLTQLRYNITVTIQYLLQVYGLYKGALDGDFGPKSTEAFDLYTATS